jgi:hypothetical protein
MYGGDGTDKLIAGIGLTSNIYQQIMFNGGDDNDDVQLQLLHTHTSGVIPATINGGAGENTLLVNT